MSSGYKSIADIAPGSRWVAADGGHYGYVVVGPSPDPVSEDVIVLGFRDRTATDPSCHEGDVFDSDPRSINYFKLQYRYYELANGYDDTSDKDWCG